MPPTTFGDDAFVIPQALQNVIHMHSWRKLVPQARHNPWNRVSQDGDGNCSGNKLCKGCLVIDYVPGPDVHFASMGLRVFRELLSRGRFSTVSVRCMVGTDSVVLIAIVLKDACHGAAAGVVCFDEHNLGLGTSISRRADGAAGVSQANTLPLQVA